MSRRPDSEVELVLRNGMHGWVAHKPARRLGNPIADWLAQVPIIWVLGVTLIIGVALAPIGLALTPVVLMIRHHGVLSREFSEVFGPDSDEYREWRERPGDLGRALELDRSIDFVTDPQPGGFIAPDRTGEVPRFRPGFGRKGL